MDSDQGKPEFRNSHGNVSVSCYSAALAVGVVPSMHGRGGSGRTNLAVTLATTYMQTVLVAFAIDLRYISSQH